MSVNDAFSQLCLWRKLLQLNQSFQRNAKPPPLLLLIPLPSSYALPTRATAFPTLPCHRNLLSIPPAPWFPVNSALIAPAVAPTTLRSSTPRRWICRFGSSNSDLLRVLHFCGFPICVDARQFLRFIFTVFKLTYLNFLYLFIDIRWLMQAKGFETVDSANRNFKSSRFYSIHSRSIF